MAKRKVLRRRYGRATRYGEQKYRGYKLVTGTLIRGGKTVGYDCLVMKKGFTDARAEAADLATAILKAKRIVDAMHGD